MPEHQWRRLLDTLGLGIEQMLRHVGLTRPQYPAFVDWIIATAGVPEAETVARYHAAIDGAPPPPATARRLAEIAADDGWADLDVGGCRIAIHAGGPGAKRGGGSEGPHKLCFLAEDVAAARADLIARGVKIGPLKTFGALQLSDAADPDGNRIQLSNRS